MPTKQIKASNRCLHAPIKGSDPDAAVQSTQCVELDKKQNFKFNETTQALYSEWAGDRCLTAEVDSLDGLYDYEDGASLVMLRPCDGSERQRWAINLPKKE